MEYKILNKLFLLITLIISIHSLIDLKNESVINGYSPTFREWLDGYAQNNHETRILTEDITKKIETQDYSYLPLSAHEETDYNGHCGGGSSFTNDMSFRVVRNAN